MVLPKVKCWMCVIKDFIPLSNKTWLERPPVETQYPDYCICNACPASVFELYKTVIKEGREDRKWLAEAVKEGDDAIIPSNSLFKYIKHFKDGAPDGSHGFDIVIFYALARYGLTPFTLETQPVSELLKLALDNVKSGKMNSGSDDIFSGHLRPDGFHSWINYDLRTFKPVRLYYPDYLKGMETYPVSSEPFRSTNQVFRLTKCSLICSHHNE